MKKIVFYISVCSLILFCGCYDDSPIESKPGESIDPVTNLQANIREGEEEDIVLNWDLPSDYPEDVIEPVSVHIQVKIDGRREGGDIVLDSAPETYTYSPYDESMNYSFTVKVLAIVETSEPHESDLRYSLGETVEL
tara:strand:- start:365 stop:775 length:411 start_codon:yes stop_codon:yes gene_type:complete